MKSLAVVAESETESRMRFLVSFPISRETRHYRSAEQSVDSPVASKIFGFPWTAEIIVGPKFVEIVKQEWVDWSILKAPLQGLLEEHFQKFGELSEDQSLESSDDSLAQSLTTPLAKSIQRVLDEEINPSVAGHGGYIEMVDLKDGVVYVEMRGGCQGCGMATQTLKHGVEVSLKKAFPEIHGVVDITDHGRGLNPFVKR